MDNKNFIAGEDIKSGQTIVIHDDGKGYRHEQHIEFWETLGFNSYSECMKDIKKRIPEIVAKGEHKHYHK